MDKITVRVGTKWTTSSGFPQQSFRDVEFEGEQLAKRTEYHGRGDSRGTTETLYKTADRYVVYVEDWTRWQGETSKYSLIEVTEDDLGLGGGFEQLGREAGFGRPMTLDEALTDA